MRRTLSNATKMNATQVWFSPKTAQDFIRETDFDSIRNERSRINPEKQRIKYLYLRCKEDIYWSVCEREEQWDFHPISYKISSPRLVYLENGFDLERRTEALVQEKSCEFIEVKNLQYPDMVIKVDYRAYCLMKKAKAEKPHEFLHRPYCPHVFKKEDYPKLFKGKRGSFCLVECKFPARIALGYLIGEKFKKEKMPYRILVISKAEKKKYLKDLLEVIEGLEFSACGTFLLPSVLFNYVFPRLSDLIGKFERDKNVSGEDVKFLNEIKCFCEFKFDAVLMFLSSIMESFVNLLLAHKVVDKCQSCGDLRNYKKGKKYCSLTKEGKDCGKKARSRRDYERHKDKRQRYYTQQMKITRDFLKKYRKQ